MGVRQGENLFPFLFSIFLSDLEKYLMERNVNGAQYDINTDDIYLYMKVLVLLYADEAVLFSDNKEDLQKSLNDFGDKCTQ